MYRRTRKIKNPCGDTRLLKLVNEGSIIEISSDVSDVSFLCRVENNEEYISLIEFDCGPIVEIGSYITLSDFGKCKIIAIYPSAHNNPNEFLLEIIKLNDKEKRK